MIQRLQTLFLLAVVLICILLIYLPVFEFQGDTISADPLVTTPATGKPFTVIDNGLLLILNGAIGVLSFVAIFLYRKRNIQIRMCNLALLLNCVLVGLLFFVADTMSTNLNQRVHYMYGSYLPLISLLFLFLAVRFIKKDEEMVRSADRLR